MIISIQKDAADRTGLGSNKRKLVKDKDNAKWFTENVKSKRNLPNRRHCKDVCERGDFLTDPTDPFCRQLVTLSKPPTLVT